MYGSRTDARADTSPDAVKADAGPHSGSSDAYRRTDSAANYSGPHSGSSDAYRATDSAAN
jgi:hypothetical protein